MAIGKVKQKGVVGVMIVGHKEYWPQFPNQRADNIASGECFEELLERCGAEVIRYVADDGTQMIDTPEKAFEAGIFFKKHDIDLCFIYLPNYVASGRYMIGAKQVCCPIILIGHQVQHEVGSTPVAESGSYGGPCCVTEAYNALERCGIEPKDFIFGRQSGKWYAAAFEKEVNEWCRVADAIRSYKGAIFGHLGHSYEGMLDMNFDPTTFTRSFGVHVKMLEMCELVEYVKGATEAEIKEKLDEMNENFIYLDPSYDSTTVPINQEDIDWAAQCAVGLDKLVATNHLSAMAYYYEGLDNYYERVASNLIIGNSLLVSKGISLAGESDMKTCMAMYTTSAIGAGGSFAEYGIDLADNIMLVGHDGPHDIRISDAKPTIRGLGLYHGKRGHGISVEFSLKTGPITMLGLSVDINGRFRFIGAEAESQRGPVPQNGNTYTRALVKSPINQFVVDWAKAGNTHHLSLCLGHNNGVIKKLASALPDVKFIEVE
ncbi:MAG: arabinose isomerase [Chloroflexi bacterium]|nr:arabinose isomerase [Chloroflexota bacterium]